MGKVLAFLKGKKAYIVSAAAIIICGLQITGVIGTIPEYVWTLLAALGLGAVRAAIGKVEK